MSGLLGMVSDGAGHTLGGFAVSEIEGCFLESVMISWVLNTRFMKSIYPRGVLQVFGF